MSFLHHIQSVAKYESKLLIRSWFFRVFTVLALVILGFFNIGMLLMEDNGISWILKSISSNIPYFNLLFLNTGQAVIAIFLASDFLKRDKKLDTSEVFYVHSLSNAEYVIGKIWGNLRVFLILNIIVMTMSLIFNYMAPSADVDGWAYIQYFLIICIPTLIFIIGLSIFLMLIFKNQALTFIILLGYIGLTLFYIGNKFYYLFDYMAYSLPLVKSTIVGFTNYATIFIHRGIYLFAGFACIFFTIALFNRLPNYSRSSYPWIVGGICSLVFSLFLGYSHVNNILTENDNRLLYTSINNKYAKVPKMVVNTYDISLEQQLETIHSEVKMNGTALASSSVFSFCLNPGLQIDGITAAGNPVNYTREHQIILADFGKEIPAGDSISLVITYHGKIDPNFCYLDIPEEVLQEENKKFFLNVDKKYVFQSEDYVLFTPETYWYPRPGISYSDENPDWQQTYFSHFQLKVKPLPGLTALSQGGRSTDEHGVSSFVTDYPAQAISLTIGKYHQKSLEADSTLFSVWYIDGHDFFTAEFDSIMDTIPAITAEMKQNMQRHVRLDYPFSRFSIIEVPAQFHSYSRAWSQSQETMQPEIVFFPEKGWLFDFFDIKKRWKNHIKWSEWSGRKIDENEAKINTLRDIMYLFQQPESNYNFSSVGRGQHQLTAESNPYYAFPQFYNFCYNIFSSEWSVANRVIELYLQSKSYDQGWERDYNGISNNEKANLLFEKHSFKELLADVEYRDILDNIIGLKGGDLFARPEMNIGVNVFRDSVYTLLKRNPFRNLQFETILDTLGQIGQADLHGRVATWNAPTPLPLYNIYQPEVTRINDKGKEVFVVKQLVSNHSDTEGILHIMTVAGGYWGSDPDPKANRKVLLEPRQSKLLVTVWEDAPRQIMVYTLISNNLPSDITLPIRNIVQEHKTTIDQEGDFIVEATINRNPNEIIVDNEDPLFVLSEPAIVGLLPKWLDKVEDSQFKYVGVSSWRPPLQWTATTNGGYYGEYVRSAYVIKSGDGSQTATWKIPLQSPGYYEIYYWAFSQELRYNRRHTQGEYHFKIKYNDEVEDAYINMRNASEEWEQLGVYYLDTDTLNVVLTNESKLRSITADAVRVVKRQ